MEGNKRGALIDPLTCRKVPCAGSLRGAGETRDEIWGVRGDVWVHRGENEEKSRWGGRAGGRFWGMEGTGNSGVRSFVQAPLRCRGRAAVGPGSGEEEEEKEEDEPACSPPKPLLYGASRPSFWKYLRLAHSGCDSSLIYRASLPAAPSLFIFLFLVFIFIFHSLSPPPRLPSASPGYLCALFPDPKKKKKREGHFGGGNAWGASSGGGRPAGGCGARGPAGWSHRAPPTLRGEGQRDGRTDGQTDRRGDAQPARLRRRGIRA